MHFGVSLYLLGRSLSLMRLRSGFLFSIHTTLSFSSLGCHFISHQYIYLQEIQGLTNWLFSREVLWKNWFTL